MILVVHGRRSSRHRRQILFRSHFNRLNLLLLRLLLVHITAVALVRQLRLDEVHLGTKLSRLLELILANGHPRFVHFDLHIVSGNLFLRIPVVQ